MKKINIVKQKKRGKKDKPWKTKKTTNQKPHQEDGHWPRRVWPTDQEKHKGPKI